MPYLSLKDATIYYESQGQGPEIVLIHGAGGNHGVWWQQIPVFSQRFHVTAFDMRGFGLSREKAGSPGGAAFTSDLEALLEHLQIEHVVLIGQSLGGWPCMAYTALHPDRVRGIVFAGSTAGINEPRLRARMVEVVRGVEELPMKDRALSSKFREANPITADLYRQFNSFNSSEAPIKRGRTVGPSPKELEGLTVPSIFIGGQEDLGLPPDALAMAQECVPGSQIRLVPGAGHSVYFEQPEVFNALVLDFLDSHTL